MQALYNRRSGKTTKRPNAQKRGRIGFLYENLGVGFGALAAERIQNSLQTEPDNHVNKTKEHCSQRSHCEHHHGCQQNLAPSGPYHFGHF